MGSGRPLATALAVSDPEMERLRSLATAHRLALFPKDKLLTELGQAIARRMVKRNGMQIYQILSCTLPYFPREVLQDVFPARTMKENSETRMSWELSTSLEVAEIVGPILQRSTYVCAGSTKAFRTRTERVIRVVAKLMAPFEICHEVSKAGTEKCYLNGLYTLVTQDGEFHYPKDNHRRELEVSTAEQKLLRQGVMADMEEMGRAGHPLSPNWWRQLGQEDRARCWQRSV